MRNLLGLMLLSSCCATTPPQPLPALPPCLCMTMSVTGDLLNIISCSDLAAGMPYEDAAFLGQQLHEVPLALYSPADQQIDHVCMRPYQ